MSESQPQDANTGCVGPTSQKAGKSSACDGCPNQSACSTGKFNNPTAKLQKATEEDEIRASLACITHVILVLSGKGGVGKSTVSCQLSQTLASRGYTVGLLDVDICGPSAPRMLGVHGREVHKSGSGWTPVYVNENLSCMSVAFLLSDADAAVVWRGPRKNGMIKQFLTETDWAGAAEEGVLDYLIIDTPPGTSDEHISTVQYLQAASSVSGAIVVTTPEEASMADVRKELNFCKKTKVPVLGLVENMASFKDLLPNLQFFRKPSDGGDGDGGEEECTAEILTKIQTHLPELLQCTVGANVFPPSGGGPTAMAQQYNIPLLASLPLDPNLLKSCDEGLCFVDEFPNSSGVYAMNVIADKLLEFCPPDDEEELEEDIEPVI